MNALERRRVPALDFDTSRRAATEARHGWSDAPAVAQHALPTCVEPTPLWPPKNVAWPPRVPSSRRCEPTPYSVLRPRRPEAWPAVPSCTPRVPEVPRTGTPQQRRKEDPAHESQLVPQEEPSAPQDLLASMVNPPHASDPVQELDLVRAIECNLSLEHLETLRHANFGHCLAPMVLDLCACALRIALRHRAPRALVSEHAPASVLQHTHPQLEHVPQERLANNRTFSAYTKIGTSGIPTRRPSPQYRARYRRSTARSGRPAPYCALGALGATAACATRFPNRRRHASGAIRAP